MTLHSSNMIVQSDQIRRSSTKNDSEKLVTVRRGGKYLIMALSTYAMGWMTTYR